MDHAADVETPALSTWRPDDYIIHGRYCDTASISTALENLREHAGARGALLIVYRGSTLFQSLLLAAHVDPAEADAIQDALAEEAFVEVPRGADPFALVPATPATRRRLRALAKLRPLRAVTDFLASPLRIVGRPAGRPPARAAGMAIVLVGRSRPHQYEDDFIDHLHSMVNSTSSVVVHRDIGPEQDLDTALTEARAIDGNANDEQVFLRAAMRLTHSSVGNFYLATRDLKSLELAAMRNNAQPLPTLTVSEDSVVGYVYTRRRPLVINDIVDFSRMHRADYRSVTGGEEAYAELAVPVVQYAPIEGGSIVLGVLNVEKIHRAEGYYTDTDLQLLRLLAERYCVLRTQRLLAESARALEQFTRRNVTLLEAATRVEKRAAAHLHIPADLWPAKPDVDDIVGSLYKLTRGHSVTVRLLTTDCARLLRFSAYPPERMYDPWHRIKVSNPESINAHVARTGQELYVPDFLDLEWRRRAGTLGRAQARAGTRCELCLPIFVDSRLAGTLNLEGQHADSFVETQDIARAVTQQVALALARARRFGEQVVFSMTSASTANVHELSKIARRLRNGQRGVPDAAGIASDITRCIRQGAVSSKRRGVTLNHLVATVCRENDWSSWVQWEGSDAHDPIRIARSYVAPLKYALEELLRNGLEHQLNAEHPFGVIVEPHERTLGGRSYVGLRLRNAVDNSVSRDTLLLLYRAPIPDGLDLHIGAFTAAAGVRSLGGDVYALPTSGRTFESVLEIPTHNAQSKR